MQGVFWDVTKSRRDEEAVYRQANLLNMVDDAIVVSDLEGKIQFWNQGAAKIYDLPAAQAIGADVVELLSRDTKEYLNASRKTCRTNGTINSSTNREPWDRSSSKCKRRWKAVP